MLPERPDISQLDPKIIEYIESLETEISRLQPDSSRISDEISVEPLEYHEPPTTINVVTISKAGVIKRTPRHLYTRQRRGGMGVFDLDIPENDAPAHILTVDESQQILLLTDFARGYWLSLSDIPASDVRSRGQNINTLLDLPEEEKLIAAVPGKSEGYLALLSQKGYVRLLRHNFVGQTLSPGTSLLDTGRFGPLATVGWISANEDVFIATRNGLGIRFRSGVISPTGSLGIRVEEGDAVMAVCGTSNSAAVFLMSADGKGTIRQMSGFRANKAPGAGGKVAMKTDKLIGAIAVDETDDLFVISRLAKIIRFQASEIPQKTGVVQGVHCISLRADEAVAISSSTIIPI